MARRNISTTSNRKGERGNVLAYTVMSALFLFFAVGLSVDLGHLYLVKAELQNTADAAALAGASALKGIPDDVKIATAVNRALGAMNANRYNFDKKNYVNVMTMEDQRALVKFARNLNDTYVGEGSAPVNSRFVHVKTPAVPVTMFFAAPLMGATVNLDAQATAGLSVPGNRGFCPAPLAVIDCGTNASCSGLGGVCYPPGPSPSTCNPDKQLCKNCYYTIRSQPAGGPAPGNYHALCCGTGTCNANWLKAALAGTQNCGMCPTVNPGDEITPDTSPGEKQAAIRDGLNTRLDIYHGGQVNPTDHPPDPNVYGKELPDILSWNDYKTSAFFEPPTHTSAEDRRILVLPITPIDSWNDVNGSDTVTASGFGGFFLRQRVPMGSGPEAGNIQAEYIGDEVITALGYDPNSPITTNLVTLVLYR